MNVSDDHDQNDQDQNEDEGQRNGQGSGLHFARRLAGVGLFFFL